MIARALPRKKTIQLNYGNVLFRGNSGINSQALAPLSLGINRLFDASRAFPHMPIFRRHGQQFFVLRNNVTYRETQLSMGGTLSFLVAPVLVVSFGGFLFAAATLNRLRCLRQMVSVRWHSSAFSHFAIADGVAEEPPASIFVTFLCGSGGHAKAKLYSLCIDPRHGILAGGFYGQCSLTALYDFKPLLHVNCSKTSPENVRAPLGMKGSLTGKFAPDSTGMVPAQAFTRRGESSDAAN